MCLAQFFGDLSPFQIIVSAVAFATGIYTLYKSFLEKARLSLYPGDAVRILVSEDRHVSDFHLMFNLVNKSNKVGTVHRLEVGVLSPQGSNSNFIWNQFYKYQPGGESVEKESDVYPFAVPKMDSKLLMVGFHAETNQRFKWSVGKYEFKVKGWVNRKDRNQSSNLTSVFHIQITEEKLSKLNQPPPPPNAVYVTMPVEEWERQHR